MKYKALIYYSNLALSQKDNDFISNFLEQGCKIIEEEINENSKGRYQIDIEYLHLAKGEKGINQLFQKLDTIKEFFIINAHVLGSNNKKIIEHLKNKEFFYFHNSLSLGKGKNLFDTRRTDHNARLAFISEEIEKSKEQNIYYLHAELRLFEKMMEQFKNSTNFNVYSLKGYSSKEKYEIKNHVNKIFSKLKKDDLIILDLGLKCFREVFLFLEENGFKNTVINTFGSLDNRFKKISFDLIQLITKRPTPSLSLIDIINKIFKEDIGPNRTALLLDSAYRLEIPLLLSQALNKCDDMDINNKDIEKIRSAILSFDGKKDIFVGKALQYAFNQDGKNILTEDNAYIFPNSLQIKDYDVARIMHDTQFQSVDNVINKKKVIYAYIDILRVTNIDIKSRFWTAELYFDIVSQFENPLDEILFNNLSTLNDKFSYKKIWKRDDKNNYNTQRYYVVANFDFLPVADNYPFDWQNVYIALTLKDNAKLVLQPIPLKLIDHDFDISGWTIQSDFSGVKFQKNHLFQDVDLKKTVSISSENRAGWILKRKNTATLLKIGIPMFFLIFLVYYSVFLEYEEANSSIGILTTTFLSAIALYFSVEKPEPKRMTIIDLIFVWFYIINGITVVSCGMASFFSDKIFYGTSFLLKGLIPISLIGMVIYLYRRVKRNREDILLDREV
jgi:hypothetical protein|tara:strand:+ start:5091 stop:7106 length:2016 start_codon:yes stop_codon:yes gene_type:complete